MLGACALSLVAAPARAQSEPAAAAPTQAPRLQYTRGPAECLDETDFRREVAIDTGGVDLFDAQGAAVVQVWFEKLGFARYRGTVQLTAANGQKQPEVVEIDVNCALLGRWVAESTYYYMPKVERPDPTAKALADPAGSKAADLAGAVAPAEPVSNQARASTAANQAPWTWPPPPPSQTPAPRPPASFHDRIRKLIRDMDLTIALNGLVLVTAGFSADAGPGFGIGVDVRGERFSFGLELRGVLPSKAYAREQLNPAIYSGPVELDASQVSALLVPCVRFAKYFAGCGVVQGGVLFLDDVIDSSLFPLFALGPRFAVEVPVTDQVAVFGFGDALIKVYGGKKEYYDDLGKPLGAPGAPGVVWKTSPVSGYFGAGLVVKFQ